MNRTCVLLLATMAATSQGSLIANGSFEDGFNSNGPGGTTLLGGGSGTISSWVVTGDAVLWIGNSTNSDGIFALAGVMSMDLAGNFNGIAGGIEQTFATNPGWQYEVKFDTGTKDTAWGLNRIRVSAAGQFGSVSDTPFGTMAWRSGFFNFTATSALTTLRFEEEFPGQSNYCGIDNVRVDAVPEPGSMLGIALGAVVALRRRRT